MKTGSGVKLKSDFEKIMKSLVYYYKIRHYQKLSKMIFLIFNNNK